MLRICLRDTAQPASHEDLFIARYGRLLESALQITGRDQEQAGDLVQDAFIQFTLGRPPLDEIQNVDAYLYGMLRNMHLSEVRRRVRGRAALDTLLDYDFAETALRATDGTRPLQSRQELRLICQYACARSRTSKCGSVLLLRYFHGYYPKEIARILCSPARAVDDWLRLARREARRYVENAPPCKQPYAPTGQSRSECLAELRAVIFAERHRICPTEGLLRESYEHPRLQSVDCAVLGQIVTCPRCLDAVNVLLDLPLLADRYPMDMLGPHDRSGGGHSGEGSRYV